MDIACRSRGRSPRILFAFVVSLGIGVGSLRSAEACSEPERQACDPYVVLVRQAAEAPANLPGFTFYDDTAATIPVGVELRDLATGELVPSTTEDYRKANVRRRLLTPTHPLQPGAEYQFVTAGCTPSDASDYIFRAGPERPLPTALGRLERLPPRTGTMIEDTCSSYFQDSVGASTTLTVVRVVYDEATKPWARLLEMSLAVDGVDAFLSNYSGYFGGGSPLESFDLGFRSDCTAAASPPEPNRHHVRLSAHIPGATAQPSPLEFEIDLTCPTKPTPPTTVEPASEEAPASDAGCACATRPRDDRAAARWGAAVLVGIVSAVGAARRRQRAT